MMRTRPGLQRLRRLTAVLLVVSLGAGLAPMPAHAQCGDRAERLDHDAASSGHAEHHQPAEVSQAAIDQGAEPCDHCPADQCAAMTGCGGASVSAFSRPTAVARMTQSRAVTSLPWRPLLSFSANPPTPPPTYLL